MAKRLSIYVPLLIFAIITLVPFVYLTCSALKGRDVFFSSPFLPTEAGGAWHDVDFSGLTWDNFRNLFSETGIGRATVNSFFFASVTSVLATLCSAMGGYALAKFQFRGRGAVFAIVMASLVVPWTLLLAPGYQLLYWLGLLDSYTGLVLPAIAPAFGVYLFRQAMVNALPNEMMEAARIDGCGELRMFFTIALPMVRPMIGAFLLITYLGTWNNFIGPQIVLQTPEKYPLAVAVAQMKGVYSTDWGMIMAGTLVGIAPVLVLFLMLQRDFIAGLTAGAVKG